jgi:GNAT superfamily N-acetyltransferase
MKEIKISFKPKQKNLDDISIWLLSKTNWICAIRAYENKSLVIALYKGETVGFYALSKLDLTISIDVAEVNPIYRRKGIGKLILEEIIKRLKNKESYALQLFCEPESSQKIWKKLGFKYFPENLNCDRFDKPTMYKIIKPYLKFNNVNTKLGSEIIEIWNDEPIKTRNENPIWVWNLKYTKNTQILKKPIIHFGDNEWRIRWKKGNEIIKDCKYKHFDRKNEEFSCMVIRDLVGI